MDPGSDKQSGTNPGPEAKNQYWKQITARFYLSIPSPMRPVEEDVLHYSKAASGWLANGRAPRILILGVTPVFYFMPWPKGTEILAVDHSEHMIRNVWPGEARQALCAEWTTMPLPDHSRDLVFCDGGISFLRYPDELAGLAGNLQRIVAPGGLFITRIFEPGPDREDPGQVIADFLAGRISNSGILKLRLEMALGAGSANGVKLDDVWRYYAESVGDTTELPARTGWSDAELGAIARFAGCEERYYFPTAEQVCAVLCTGSGAFACHSIQEPSYDLHEHVRLLTFVLQGKNTP